VSAPAPIGVFDSGHGGLTVLAALQQRLPWEHFLYLGDHAAAPYGQRSPEEIYQRTQGAVELLFALGCRLVLLACNTAAAVALRRLQQGWLARNHPDRRVLGVLVPMVEALSGRAWHEAAPAGAAAAAEAVPRHILVFATTRTVESGAYSREVRHRAPWIAVSEQACAGLAGAIEAGAADPDLAALIAGYTAEALGKTGGAEPDAAVLGCTHYPLVENLFAARLPAATAVLSQPKIVAGSLARYLARHAEFAGGPGETRFLTTGDPQRVSPLATRFLGEAIRFRAIQA